MTKKNNPPWAWSPGPSAIKRDLRSPKYKPRVVPSKKRPDRKDKSWLGDEPK